MPLDKIIQVRLNDEYLEKINEILEFEKENYHFVGNVSDLMRLLIYCRHKDIKQNNR